MSVLSAAVRHFAEAIATGSAAVGTRVEVGEEVLDARAAWMNLAPPGERSPNGSCRMMRAADGWIAVNLPREDDLASVPAWVDCGLDDEPWAAIAEAARAARRGFGAGRSAPGSAGRGGRWGTGR